MQRRYHQRGAALAAADHDPGNQRLRSQQVLGLGRGHEAHRQPQHQRRAHALFVDLPHQLDQRSGRIADAHDGTIQHAEALRLTPVDGEGVWTGPYLQSFAYTIGGGTTDIQRNIVGERVLGLPRA